jgi:hypothetical protein
VFVVTLLNWWHLKLKGLAKRMATKESLNRRLDKVITVATGGKAEVEPLRSEARLLPKELEEYIDAKIETALRARQ